MVSLPFGETNVSFAQIKSVMIMMWFFELLVLLTKQHCKPTFICVVQDSESLFITNISHHEQVLVV